jgi:hypothetical protein
VVGIEMKVRSEDIKAIRRLSDTRDVLNALKTYKSLRTCVIPPL